MKKGIAIIFVFTITLILTIFLSADNNTISFKNYAIDLSTYNNISDSQVQFINEKYNLILVNKYNDKFKNKHQILVYNLLFSDENKDLPETAYTHSIKSPFEKKRIKNKNNNKFLMNIFSKEYENFVLNNLVEITKGKQFFGILFKDVNFNLSSFIDYAPDGYDKNKYTEQILYLLKKVKSETNIKNILVSGIYENISSFNSVNFFNNLNYGGITNNFVYSIFKIFNSSNEKIYVKFLNLVNNFSKSNFYIAYNKLKGIYMDKLTVEERLYSFTSYLFIFNPNIYYLIEDLSIKTPVQYYPEMDIDLGNPVESFQDITFYYDKYIQIYKRKFEKGIVMVNPFPFSKIVTLDKYYTKLKFSGSIIDGKENNINITKIKAKQIIIPAYSGVILLNNE